MKNRTLTSEVAVTEQLVILNKAKTPKTEGRGIFLEGRESPTMRTRSLLVIYFMHTLLCLGAETCLTLCNPLDFSPPGSSVHEDSPGKNTGVCCHALL